MFTVDLGSLKVDCDPHPQCVRLAKDKPMRSSLNPTLEQVLLDSHELGQICDAYLQDRAALDVELDADEDVRVDEMHFAHAGDW